MKFRKKNREIYGKSGPSEAFKTPNYMKIADLIESVHEG
jgi:hypothetical protein